MVIPARYASTRLPGKPLADICGQPMIARVYAQAAAASSVHGVVVATDDERIAAAVRAFGGSAVLTSPAHESGTDRIAEVARGLDADLIVNVQGDEPLLDPASIDRAVAPLLADDTIEMGTLGTALTDPADADNPNVVKVVVDRRGFALYFSRSPLPYRRHPADVGTAAYRHIGMYVYRRSCLLRLAGLARTPLEQAESLEQLRALEHGIRIRVVDTPAPSIAVDTPDDLERVRQLVAARALA